MPVRTAVTCFYREGTRKRSRTVGYQPASIGVVEAFSWISEFLLRSHGPQSEWRSALAWFQNRQCTEPRTDYCDVGPIIADCVLGQDRTVLLEEVLKTKDGDLIRDGILKSQFGKDFKGLPPKELARRFDRNQQLQLLLVASTDILVKTLDRLVLANQIGVPTSELRYARKRLPKRNVCFHSELSSLGIRPAHPEPYAALNSAILRAYRETGSLSELSWRLGSDPSRGVQVTLTEIVRNEGPAEAVAKLVLASQPVTEIICRELGLDLREIIPRTNRTIPRILWKFGFEIPRHEPVLIHLNRRMTHFEETLAEVDYGAGEKAKEKIRESGVNLFVSVEELLDHLISYNVWLLSSDHWGKTEFEYRLSEARKSVSNTLGTSIASVDGEVQWKVNGENALGTQLAYLSELDKWLDSLTEAKKVARQDVAIEHAVDDFNRPFPFRHTQLWADSDFVELERYKDTFRKIAKSILQADIAGIRNALDHQRGESRFPSEEQLLLCVTRLRMGVRAAEQSRIYPVTYWFNSSTDRVFGASEHRFENAQGEILTIYRPSTVSSLPSITRIHPVIFAPVNFFGAADSLLFFKRMGESDYSRYWSDFPPISKLIVDSDDEFDAEQIDGETVSSISE